MAITLAQTPQKNSNNTGATVTATFASTTSGNAIIVCALSRTAGTLSVSDGVNSYTSVTSASFNFGVSLIQMWYAPNIAGGGVTVTVTDSVGNNSKCLIILEYSGLATTSPLDQSTNVLASFTGTVATTNSVTTLQASELLLGMFAGVGGTTTYTQGTGYTLEASQNTGATDGTLGVEDEIVAVTGSYNAVITSSTGYGTSNFAGILATFKGAVGGGGRGLFEFPLLNGISTGGQFFSNPIG